VSEDLAAVVAQLAEEVRQLRAFVAPGAGERLTYKRSELPAVIGVSLTKIDEATHSGELPVIPWNGVYLYRVEDVRDWLARGVRRLGADLAEAA